MYQFQKKTGGFFLFRTLDYCSSLKFCESDALTLTIYKPEKVNFAHINPSKEIAADFVGKQLLTMELEVVFAGLIL